MKFENKYDIGDEVWGIAREYEVDRYVDCVLCRASGRVTVLENDALTAECPSCFGRRRIYSPTTVKAHPVVRTIGQVQVTVYLSGDGVKQKVTYMCEETGVGSGTIHLEDDLYPIHDDAKRAIEGSVNK